MKKFSISSIVLIVTLVLVGLIHSVDVEASRRQNAATVGRSSVATQKPGASIHKSTGGQGIFIIANVNGRQVCRIATPDEVKQVTNRDPNFPLHLISSPSKARAAVTNAISPQATTGLNIILMGTDQLEGFPDAKKAFVRAASHWEALIQTPITIILDVDFGPTAFGTPFGPNVIGSTDTETLVDSPDTTTGNGGYSNDIRPALITSGTTQEAQIYSQLPTGSVPADIGAATTVVAPSANFRALGLLPAAADVAGDYSNGLGLPPAIGFNTLGANPNDNWDFDPSDGITNGKLDFDATVTHEIGHALGFSSEVGDHALNPGTPVAVTPWDIFRFRSGTTVNTFQAATRILSTGGDQEFFNGANDTPVSTGDPNGNGGDGWQASHWQDDVQESFATRRYIGIMHPVADRGARYLITNDDLKVLDLIGYTLTTNSQPNDVLSVDDGTAEAGGTGSSSIVLNRLTPVKYPSTLQTIRVFIRPVNGQPSPAGTRVRMLAYSAASPAAFAGTASPRPLVDQNIFLPDPGPNGGFVDLNLPLGPSIDSGDWYIGFQLPGGSNVAVGEDTSSAFQQRSFISNDNGNSFSTNGITSNFMLRAVETSTGCLFSLSSNGQSFDKGGGGGTFNVTTSAGCSWTPVIGENWMSSSSSGTGNGQVSFTVAPNTETVARTGIIAIGDQTFTISETAADLLSTQSSNPVLQAAQVHEQCVLQPTASQLQVTVPANAFQMDITLDGGSADVDLYVNFNHSISTIPNPQTGAFNATFSSTSPTGQEEVTINSLTTPSLQPGTYFIAIANCETSQITTTLRIKITGSSGQTCSFIVTPGVLSFSASGGQSSAGVAVANGCSWTASSSDTSWLTITAGASGSGNGTVSYTAAPNPNPVARSATLTVAGQNFTVNEDAFAKQNQTITFNSIPDHTFGDPQFGISAVASSGLPVSFLITTTNNAAVLTVDLSGNTSVVIHGAGPVTIQASQAGNSTFNAATPVSQSFNINKENQTITFGALPNRTFGDQPFTLNATASSQLPVSFSVASGPATISGNSVTIIGAGQVTINANQAGNANINAAPQVPQSFTVAPENQTITFNPIPDHTFGDAQFFLSATASSGLQVSFSVVSGPAVLSGNGVTVTGTGLVTIKADQSGNANISAAPSVTQSFNVVKANQSITFGPISNHAFGDAPFTLSASSSSGLAVSFNVVSGPATLNGSTLTLNGAGAVTIEADQNGDANHNAAPPVQQTFTVAKGLAVINLSNLVQIFDGNPRAATVTTSPNGLSGLSVTYNGSPAPPTVIGSYSLVASLSNANFQASNATATFKIVGLSPTDSQNVSPGNQVTASVLPNGGPGVTADLTHTGRGVIATVSVGVYSDNPTASGVVNAGGGFVDVKVVQSNSDDTLVINYYYPSGVTGANETALQLLYFNGTSWLPVIGSGGSAPIKNTTDNLDGTISGGRFTVTLDNTSSPTVTALSGTPFAATTAVMGDLNGDGVVTVSDLVVLANVIAGNLTLTPVQKAAADVSQNGSGQLDITDLVTLANFLAGNIKTMPVISP